ncbi:MAG: DUF4340 domain-containing protein [Gemmatimonadota bacterium]|nr:MAG: DUF4340 domain-containing protein [Gemmatimonadota bacterium]
MLKTLVGVLAVLVVAWALMQFVGGRGGGPERAPFTLSEAAELDLDSVVIAAADDTIRLRGGADWTVNGYEAAAETQESLKRALAQAELGPLISRNSENHARLGVTRAAGRRLTVYAGGTGQLSLIVGGRGRAGDQAYLRREGDDAVYTVQGTLVSLVNRRVDEWRNKEIVQADRDLVQRIEFTYPDESFALVRQDTSWRLEPSGAAANEMTVSGLLSILSGLRAVSIAADSVADTLTWELLAGRLRLEGPEGTALAELLFLESDEVGFYVRRAGAPAVYTISSHTGGQLLKREEGLALTEEG